MCNILCLECAKTGHVTRGHFLYIELPCAHRIKQTIEFINEMTHLIAHHHYARKVVIEILLSKDVDVNV
jgi:hypothetical protein